MLLLLTWIAAPFYREQRQMMEVKRKEVKKGVVATPFELLTESVTDPFVLYLCLLVFWFWLVVLGAGPL